MKMPQGFDLSLICTPVVLAGALLVLPMQAAPVSWDGGGTNTDWTTPENWSLDALPVAADDVTIDAFTVHYNRANRTLNLSSLTLESDAVMSIGAGVLGRLGGVLTNAGTMRYAGGNNQYWRFDLGAGSVNTGTIESIEANSVFHLVSNNTSTTLTNTGGEIAAKNGGQINLIGSYHATNPGLKIEGGTISSDASSRLLVWTNQSVNANGKTTLENVTLSNAGQFYIQNSISSLAGTRNTQAVLTGTTMLTNTGTVSVLNSPTSGTIEESTTRLTLEGSASFDNQGTLNVINEATHAGTASTAYFEIISDTVSFTNTGAINVTNAAAAGSPTALFTSARSVSSSGNITVTGNANETGATFEVTGAGNDFTQTDGVFLLASGGELAAPTININGGALQGSGAVTGALNIASGATLSPGSNRIDTLTVFGDVTLAGTYAVDLDGMVFSDRLNVTGNMDISQATLSLEALNGETLLPGVFTIASYTTLFGDKFASVINGTGIAYSINYAGGGEGTDIVVTLGVIPEPATLALLMGGGCLLIAAGRRRRLKTSA